MSKFKGYIFRRPYNQLVLLVTILVLALSACSGNQDAAGLTGSWTGTVDGSGAFIAIASNGTEVMAYVCDGSTISQWFKGTAGVDAVDLASGKVDLSKGDARLQANLASDQASGSLTLADGTTYNFLAPRAAGDAGLYRLEESRDGDDWVGGWVVLNDGNLRGALVSSLGKFEAQTSLDSAARLISPDMRVY